MPKFIQNNDGDQIITIPGPGSFQFSAVRMEDLGASEYTLATIVCDISGSVNSYATELLTAIKTVVKSLRDSPRAENLLLRILTFNSQIYEIHGFKEFHMINENDYKNLDPKSTTSLYDAAYDGIGAVLEYSKRLIAKDFSCNGAVYIITDGCDNNSTTTPSMIKDIISNAIKAEEIESIITILVELNDPNSSYNSHVTKILNQFKIDAGITEHINIGNATPKTLSKLANFISQSISSQSQALNSGGPSQTLQF